ncbi:MAG: alpha/beta fold hydrolase, partial [Mycolicibacterium sp.]|nr:alpha/beta fold hydrolase [Mycolicibacterium sp.]
MDSRIVDTRLGRVRVRTSGSGETIVFWPSLLMTGDMWSDQASHFADRYHVVLVDPPGHGESEPLRGHFTFDECAWCISDLLDGLDVQWAHVVGNSWGGMIG